MIRAHIGVLTSLFVIWMATLIYALSLTHDCQIEWDKTQAEYWASYQKVQYLEQYVDELKVQVQERDSKISVLQRKLADVEMDRQLLKPSSLRRFH